MTTRRRFLRGLVTSSAIVAVAGCSGDDSSNDTSGGEGGSDPTRTETTTPTLSPTSTGTPTPEEQYPDAWFYHDGKGILIENEPETEFDSLGNLYIRGTATNTTDKDYSYVQLSWAVYDGSDAKIADGLANTAGLDAGQRWRFEALAPGAEDGESYELTEVSAY